MRLFFSGVNDSFTLISFKFASLKLYQKILVGVFLLGVFAAIGVAAQANNFVRFVMGLVPGDTPGAQSIVELQTFMQTYLQMYTSGQADWLVSLAVGFLISSVLFVPFSGYVIHGMVSHSEMVIVKDNNNYKIGDSFLFQIISSFTLVQLTGLTVAAQLITFDSPYSALAVFFTWGIWFFMSLLTIAFSWLVEYVVRKFGPKVRFLFLAIFIISISAVLFFDSNHGTTLFGLAGPIFDFMAQLAEGDLVMFFVSLFIVFVLCLIMVGFISLIASQALRLPEPLTVAATVDEHKERRGSTLPISPFLIFWKTMFRHKTVIKPVYVAVGFSVIIALMLKGQTGITTTMIVIPLAVGISLGANVFGLLSGASSWLLAIDHWRQRTLHSAALLILLAITLSYTLVYGIGVITTTIKWENLVFSLPTLLSMTVLATIVSLWLSVTRPLPFSGRARENLVSSPAALMWYVLLYMMTAGFAGNVLINMPMTVQPWAAGIIILISALLYIKLYRNWVYTEKYSTKLLNTTNSS